MTEGQAPRSAAPRDPAGLSGRVVSERYRIDKLLASGGMGAVYSGRHLLLKKRVAIKILHGELDNLPSLIERFEREAVAGAHVSHPNVASATDFGKLDDGSYFLVLEYVEGTTLYDLIRRGPLPFGRAVHIARQIAAALHAVHQKGIVHRDIKSRNVMVNEADGDHAKLIDFGLARLHEGRLSNPRKSRSDASDPGRLTDVGEIFGTVAYLAPEAQLGMDAVDARSDLYALGIVMYEMLAGKRPFEAPDLGALFIKQRTSAPPPFRLRAPGVVVPPAIEAIVMRLLEKSPDARFQTGEEVVEALELALPDGGVTAADAPPLSAALGPSSPRVARAPGTPGTGSPTAYSLAASRGPHPLTIAMVTALAIGAVVAIVRLQNPSIGGSPAAAPSLELPSASPVASAPAPPSAAALPPAPAEPPKPDVDLTAARTTLLAAARRRDYSMASKGLLALAEGDPHAFADPDIAAAARDTASSLDAVGAGDPIYAVLADARLGSAGLDVLYSIVQDRGGRHAAERAREMLENPELLARASPEMRIAFQLRVAPCTEKSKLFDRAVREGDLRTLIVLENGVSACFTRSSELTATVRALREKLGKKQ